MSGTDMVTATMSPGACERSNAYLSVACLQMQGSPGPPKCEQNNGMSCPRRCSMRRTSPARRTSPPAGDAPTRGIRHSRSVRRSGLSLRRFSRHVVESVLVEPQPVDNRVLRRAIVQGGDEEILLLCATVCLAAAVAACGSESSYTTTEGDTGRQPQPAKPPATEPPPAKHPLPSPGPLRRPPARPSPSRT